MTPDIELAEERTLAHGWAWRVIRYEAGKRTDFELRLSFADHERWSHGVYSPSHIAERALKHCLAIKEIQTLESKVLDCSLLARLVPDLDRYMTGSI